MKGEYPGRDSDLSGIELSDRLPPTPRRDTIFLKPDMLLTFLAFSHQLLRGHVRVDHRTKDPMHISMGAFPGDCPRFQASRGNATFPRQLIPGTDPDADQMGAKGNSKLIKTPWH